MKILNLVTLLVLVSCKFSGEFEAAKNLELKQVKRTVFGNDKVTVVPVVAGKYVAEVDFDKGVFKGKKLELVLNQNGKKVVEAEFKIPENVVIPEQNGTVVITAQESGQNYDLYGELKTTHTASEVRQSTRRCTYTRSVNRCEERCTTTGSTRRCERVCRPVLERHSGYQYYDYRVVTTVKKVDLELYSANTRDEVAQFAGSYSSSSEDVIGSGICR